MVDLTGELQQYVVVIDDLARYGYWPAGNPLPAGWKDAGFRGTLAECINFVAAQGSDDPPIDVQAQLSDI